MWLDKEQIEKDIQELIATTHQIEKERQQIIDRDYNGDKDAYYKATFNMKGASLWLGLPIDDIRAILLKNLPNDSPRRQIIIDGMNSDDINTRLVYPGGYDEFVEDAKKGYYGKFSDL
jgi:hypothetical protein